MSTGKRDTSAARKAALAKRKARGVVVELRGLGAEDAGSGAEPRSVASRSSNVWVLLVVVVGLVVLLIALWGTQTKASPAREGLIPWTGGQGWRVRRGQWIRPDAADSLIKIGEALTACTTVPMTLDVSREGGGAYPPHKSHREGVDVDIRMSDLTPECRIALQRDLAADGWTVWYDGPDAFAPKVGGVHKSHLHARFKEQTDVKE